MQNPDKLLSACLVVGFVLTIFGAAVYITRWVYAPYLYLIGSVLVTIAMAFGRRRTDNFVLRRLYRQQFIGTLILVASGVMMLTLHDNEWILGLCAAAVIMLYTSFRIPQEEKKDGRPN